jgi:hypothetical protein
MEERMEENDGMEENEVMERNGEWRGNRKGIERE